MRSWCSGTTAFRGNNGTRSLWTALPADTASVAGLTRGGCEADYYSVVAKRGGGNDSTAVACRDGSLNLENLTSDVKISRMLVRRPGFLARIAEMLRTFPAVAILGPRQCGKSTLAREFVREKHSSTRLTTFDLERPSDLSRLRAAPEEDLGLLHRQPGIICLDEVQRAPELFPLLRVLLDDPRRKARYLLLGSASPFLMERTSESLAGRVGFLDLTPLLAVETEAEEGSRRDRHWTRGGFPRSLLARSEVASLNWRESYIRTLLEQDIPLLGMHLPAETLRRLWTMLAHVHGGLLNASELAAGLSVSAPTVGRYIDVLEGTYVVRRLAPYWVNVGKRLTRAPKIYIRDSGLLHALLGIESHHGLRSHPKVGASWEGWVVEQVVATLGLAGERARPYFWRTHGGAEVDLLLEMQGRVIPVEIKLGAEARAGRGLIECMKDLGAKSGFIMHGGPDTYPLGRGVWALSVELLSRPETLRNVLLDPGRRATKA